MNISGPSQTFGWVGHGHHAPVNVPNIFAAAGLNTRWTPGIDPLFQVGLLYPSAPVATGNQSPKQPTTLTAPSYNPPTNDYASSVKVKKSIPNSDYKKVVAPVKDSPAVPPAYTGPVFSSQPTAKPTTTTVSTTTTATTTTTTRSTTTRHKSITPFYNLRGSPSPYDGKFLQMDTLSHELNVL